MGSCANMAGLIPCALVGFGPIVWPVLRPWLIWVWSLI